ncbi:MAG TPA: sulfite reductase subunit C, partial [Negativicutes bacterium]
IDRDAPGGKEHVGYIVDRTGYQLFKEWVLKDVLLNPEAQVAESINW